MPKTAAKKTRELMVDVARQLFARLGFRNTTMNDIADEARRGRRTLYTYFRNKDEVFSAVVERELEVLQTSLVRARSLHLKPENKLMHFIYTHLETMKEIVMRNGTLKADFFRDIWLVEKARRKADLKECLLIREILDEGVRAESFSVPDTDIMAKLLLNACKGLEVPYISGHIRQVGSAEFERLKLNVRHLIFSGIRATRTSIGAIHPDIR